MLGADLSQPTTFLCSLGIGNFSRQPDAPMEHVEHCPHSSGALERVLIGRRLGSSGQVLVTISEPQHRLPAVAITHCFGMRRASSAKFRSRLMRLLEFGSSISIPPILLEGDKYTGRPKAPSWPSTSPERMNH